MSLAATTARTRAAVLDLPPEIVCVCLELTVAPDEEYDTTRPPWPLAHICRAWRAIAIDCAALWCSIALDVGLPANCDPHGGRLARLTTQLARTKASALRIQLCHGVDSSDATHAQDLCLPLILATSSRWTSLRFAYLKENNLRALRPLLEDKASLYRLKRVELFGRPQLSTYFDALLTANRLPSLRRAILFQGGFDDWSGPVDLPWAQLTHVRAAFHVSDALELFPRWSALRVLVLAAWGDQLPATTAEFILFPNLTHLGVEKLHGLACISAPALTSLALWAGEADRLFDADALQLTRAFLARSKCTLGKLTIYNSDLQDGPALVEFLRDVGARLHTLVVVSAIDVDDLTTVPLLESLRPGSSAQLLCPRLRVLSLGSTAEIRAVLLDVLRERMQVEGTVKLEKFRLLRANDATLVLIVEGELHGLDVKIEEMDDSWMQREIWGDF
ncbi:F-box domain-containing protein [Mycena kentingensis (nom. inval.)]|nr:F-box domain-containing protein [Mycena kentingensis (nom. inval.)]